MPRGKPFKKGNPGGPGRPKGSLSGAAWAKEFADQEGLSRLASIALGKEPGFDKRLQYESLVYLCNRGYGKPSESQTVALSPSAPMTFTLSLGEGAKETEA